MENKETYYLKNREKIIEYSKNYKIKIRNTKVCKICKETKDVMKFNKKINISSTCIDCEDALVLINKNKKAIYKKKYISENPIKYTEQRKKYRENNKDKILQYKNNNKDKTASYAKKMNQKVIDSRNKYFLENKKEILIKNKQRKIKQELNKKYKQELYRKIMPDSYVLHSIKKLTNLSKEDILQNPEIIETKRLLLQLKRELKSIK
jgi:hypothetical protein